MGACFLVQNNVYIAMLFTSAYELKSSSKCSLCHKAYSFNNTHSTGNHQHFSLFTVTSQRMIFTSIGDTNQPLCTQITVHFLLLDKKTYSYFVLRVADSSSTVTIAEAIPTHRKLFFGRNHLQVQWHRVWPSTSYAFQTFHDSACLATRCVTYFSAV